MVTGLCQTGIVLYWKLAFKLQIRKKCVTKRIVATLGREIGFTLPELREEVVYRRKELNYFLSEKKKEANTMAIILLYSSVVTDFPFFQAGFLSCILTLQEKC